MGIATLLFAIYIGGGQITAEYYPAFIKSVKVAFIFASEVYLHQSQEVKYVLMAQK
ncbi:MAG: hypothetical protein JRG73_16135 [Deltaproteobacteria bacterium]|nr:hypothetical protein [Deltaproteobacteria bacterium]